jgi:hypothetical protein
MRARTLVLIAYVGCLASFAGCLEPTAVENPPNVEPDQTQPTDASSPNIVDGGVPSKVDQASAVAVVEAGSADLTGPTADAGTCADTAYCEGFESFSGPLARGDKLGPWVASVGGPVTVTVDSVRPYEGQKSLHVVMPIGGQASAMLTSAVFSGGLVHGNRLFGRAMVYFVGTPGDAGYGFPVHTHSMIFSVSGSSTEVGGPVNINMAGNGSLNYQARKGTTFELGTAGGTPSMNAWHCIQWEYDGSADVPLVVADHAQVWLDGAVVSDVPKNTNWFLATPWTSFSFGLTHLQTLVNPVEFFMDSFALDGAPIPCATGGAS